MEALWIFTTTPVFPRDDVGPLSMGLALKSTGGLTRWSAADAMLNKTTKARASGAIAKCFVMVYLYC
jgi:hypothetical protein